MSDKQQQTHKIDLNQAELDALSFALKARLALIETKALSYHGETPQSFRAYLDDDGEYLALVSLCRKFHID